MSRRLDSETVSTLSHPRATRPCIRRNAYHRRSVSRRRRLGAAARSTARSTVIGWWMIVTIGSSRCTSSMPWPSVWLSCTTSKSSTRLASTRATRRLKVRGSGNPAVHISSTSETSVRSRSSEGRGVRNGSGSR